MNHVKKKHVFTYDLIVKQDVKGVGKIVIHEVQDKKFKEINEVLEMMNTKMK